MGEVSRRLRVEPKMNPKVIGAFLKRARQKSGETQLEIAQAMGVIAGYQLDRVQRGEQPTDCKPMPSIGKGVEEVRVWDDAGTYRVIYTARMVDAVYVLHAFQKKAQASSKRDIEIARERFTQLMKVQP